MGRIVASTWSERGKSALFLSAILLAAGVMLEPEPADACGGMASAWRPQWIDVPDPRVPTLAFERVLIVHDDETEREHFIRETVFSPSQTAFGFVVPVPSRPELASVTKGTALFDALGAARKGDDRRRIERARVAADTSRRYLRAFGDEHDEPPVYDDKSGGTGTRAKGEEGSMGSARGPERPAVEVLETRRIGSFTAFVIAARDSRAFRDWMIDNDLDTRPALDAWLAYYVRLGFHFVAFRYEPSPAKTLGPLVAETVRISFDTPTPYYPYREPDHSWTEPMNERALDVWTLSSRARVPVAAHLAKPSAVSWERPWRASTIANVPWGPLREERVAYPKGNPELAEMMNEALEGLVPRTDLVLQTFEDQRIDRTGWSDVLMVPEAPIPDAVGAHTGDETRLRWLAPLLDPTLEPEADPARAPTIGPATGPSSGPATDPSNDPSGDPSHERRR